MPAGRQNYRGRVDRANNRGRIGKPDTQGAVRGTSTGERSFKGAARGRGRSSPRPRAGVRELLPDIVGNPRASAKTDHRTPGPVRASHANLPQPTQATQPGIVLETPAPKVKRVYNDIWTSGPASFAFAKHGDLDHDDDTIVIALNILDHIIRPENWNPELSNNKLSASCFFFASKLTGKTATADQVAGSIWVNPAMAAAMSQVNDGPLYDRMWESLTVNGAQVVQGYEILYEQRESLKDLLGGYSEGLEKLPLPATEKQRLEAETEDGPYIVEVAAEMTTLGYQRESGLATGSNEIVEPDNTLEAQDSAGLERVPEEEELELFDSNNEFEDFVANNE